MATKDITQRRERVLLFEREAGVENSLAFVLRAAGYEVFFADDIRQAAQISRAKRIKVLVVDLDGGTPEHPQLIARLCEGERGCRLLLIARSLEQLAIATEMPADAVLMKPFELPRITTVVADLMSDSGPYSLGRQRDTGTVAAYPGAPAAHCDWGITE